jgi:hypothetical protein
MEKFLNNLGKKITSPDYVIDEEKLYWFHMDTQKEYVDKVLFMIDKLYEMKDFPIFKDNVIDGVNGSHIIPSDECGKDVPIATIGLKNVLNSDYYLCVQIHYYNFDKNPDNWYWNVECLGTYYEDKDWNAFKKWIEVTGMELYVKQLEIIKQDILH